MMSGVLFALLPACTGKIQANTGHHTPQPIHLAATGVVHLETCPTNCMAQVQKALLTKVIICWVLHRKYPCVIAAFIEPCHDDLATYMVQVRRHCPAMHIIPLVLVLTILAIHV